MTQPSIALLAGWYYPDSVGGTESYVQMLAEALQTRGHRVAVVAPAHDATERHYEQEGIEVFRYPIVPDAPSLRRERHEGAPPYFRQFEHWIDGWRPDIAHFHSFTGTLYLHHARAFAARAIPLLMTVHVPGLTCPRGTLMRWGYIPCDGIYRQPRCSACCLQERGTPRPLAYPLAYLGKNGFLADAPGRVGTALGLPVALQRNFEAVHEAVALCKWVVAVSAWLRELLLLNGVPDEKLVLSRHGLPKEAIPPPAPRRERAERLRIGYIGRFEPIKGVHVLIEAVRGLPPEVPVELHLRGAAVGDGLPYLERLKALAGKDPRIRFEGSVSSEERTALLQDEWDILAVPSVWFETGPLVVLEAFAAGLPVLGSQLGGIAELVEEGVSGMLVEPGNVGAWQRTIKALVQRWRVGAWRWEFPPVRCSEQVADEMEQLYAALLPSPIT